MENSLVVGGVEMHQNLPIVVGAGVCKRPDQLAPYLREDLQAGAIVLGSTTYDRREINPGVVQWPETLQAFEEQGFGLNSYGMPNNGFREVSEVLKQLSSPIPIIKSIAEFSPDGFAAGVEINEYVSNVKANKLNFGCSNAHDKKKVPIAYDLDDVKAILEAVKKVSRIKPIWLKLSPYITAKQRDWLVAELSKLPFQFDLSKTPVVEEDFLERLCQIIVQYPFVQALVFANTLGNVVVLDPKTGKPVTDPNGGQAGLSGEVLRPFVVSLVGRSRQLLPESIDILGCGGILSGEDAMDYFESGAAAVEIVSKLSWSNDGPRELANLIAESPALQDYLAKSMK